MAIVITVVTGLAVWLARGSTSSAKPPVLHLAGAAAEPRAMAAAVPAEATPPAEAGQDPYQLVGTLPAGQPPPAPVYRLPGATADDAATVARELHLEGTPTRARGGWVLRSGEKRLAVRDDGSWSFDLDCFGGPAAQEELTVECAYASASPVTTTTATATPSPAPSPVVTTPHIDGLAVANWTTTILMNPDGSIDSANGWTGTPQRGASYPLITAQRAFDLLQQQPRPMVDLCMVRPDGKPGCAPIPPAQVTGASLGLTLDYDAGKPVLVPAWLFAVKGQEFPLAQVAVEPQYLAAPTPGPYPTVTGIPAQPPTPAEPPSRVAPSPAG